jgi:hypothetical protein
MKEMFSDTTQLPRTQERAFASEALDPSEGGTGTGTINTVRTDP